MPNDIFGDIFGDVFRCPAPRNIPEIDDVIYIHVDKKARHERDTLVVTRGKHRPVVDTDIAFLPFPDWQGS